VWLRAPWTEACALQGPFPNHALRIVATGGQKDEGPSFVRRVRVKSQTALPVGAGQQREACYPGSPFVKCEPQPLMS
jgi:hypothetical protein